MKKFYIPYIVFCIILLTLFAIKLSYEPDNNITNTEPAPMVNDSEIKNTGNNEKKIENETNYYIVRASGNNIFLFDKNHTVIEKLDIDYNNLREYDKNMFLNGVQFNDMQEVYQLIEDFSS